MSVNMFCTGPHCGLVNILIVLSSLNKRIYRIRRIFTEDIILALLARILRSLNFDIAYNLLRIVIELFELTYYKIAKIY
jgi:hypothetical protein